MVKKSKIIGKELLFTVLRHEKTDKVPRVPFAGVHAGKLRGYTARDVLTDRDKLLESLVEVFTLDSATCAACGYMLQAAERAVAELAGAADMVKYKANSADNVARMTKMNIRNLPGICINGELKFSSLIPSNRELLEAITYISK